MCNRIFVILFGLLVMLLPCSARINLPKTFDVVQGTDNDGYHRVLGDISACPDRIFLGDKWKAVGAREAAFMKNESMALSFNATRHSKCGYVTFSPVSSRWSDQMRENVVMGNIYFESDNNACAPKMSPSVSPATMITRSIFDRFSIDARLSHINIEHLRDLFGPKSTKMLFYSNGKVDGCLKNCVYVDGDGKPKSVADGDELLFGEKEGRKSKRRSMESIVKAMLLSKRKSSKKSLPLSSEASGNPSDANAQGFRNMTNTTDSNWEVSGLDSSETQLMTMNAGRHTGPASGSSNSQNVRSESEKSTSAACFPADTLVELENGIVVRIDSLSVGDVVKAGVGEYSKVFLFTHKSAAARSTFIDMKTSSGEALQLSEGHYVYANDVLMPASSVRVGDTLSLGNGRVATVESVGFSFKAGLYNPQTYLGTIIVNNIQASVYTTAIQPSFAHLLLTPLRRLYSTIGFSTSLFDDGASTPRQKQFLSALQLLETLSPASRR